MRYNLALIGFGNVGKAFTRLLLDQREAIELQFGVHIELTGIASRRLGWLSQKHGFDLRAALANGPTALHAHREADIEQWLAACAADVVFEASSLDPRAGEPALSYLRSALRYGAHAVTANKGPIVHGYRELRALAAANGKALRFESTVMDGMPIFSLFRRCLPLISVSGFEGILNSTSNFVLERMALGASLDAATDEARNLGLAETDASADIDGIDAAVKVAVLVNTVMDMDLALSDVRRTGIRGLMPEAVKSAHLAGAPFKLVCRAARDASGVRASVEPEQVRPGSVPAGVSGTSSFITFFTDFLPGLTLIEHEPTPVTTAYGMLADFLDAVSIGTKV